jgi:hypothetical protein
MSDGESQQQPPRNESRAWNLMGPVWVFLGPGPGAGSSHRLVSDGVEVVTWSLPSPEPDGGWSWLGSRQDFLRQFRRDNAAKAGGAS